MNRNHPSMLAALLVAACTQGADVGDLDPAFGGPPGTQDEPADGDEPEDEPAEDPTEPEEPEAPPADNADALDDFILGLGHLAIAPQASKHEIPCPAVCSTWQDDGLSCAELFFSETAHLDSFIALQQGSSALWPGAIVRGEELVDGYLSPVGVARTPTTFSLSLENLTASPLAVMPMPSLSSFRELRNAILAEGVHGATPAQLSYEIHSISSVSQLSLEIGAGLDWDGVIDLDAMFDFDDSTFANKYLFDFTQTYYTADVDTPPRPSGLIDPATTVQQLSTFVGPDNPPLYVQSISYGRRVLFGIESNESLEAIVAAVDAAIAEVVNVDVGAGSTDALTGAKITASVLGGDGDAAVKTVLGIQQLLEYITAGGNYAVDSPGVPIAFRLAYLDNIPTRLALTSEYPEIHCQ